MRQRRAHTYTAPNLAAPVPQGGPDRELSTAASRLSIHHGSHIHSPLAAGRCNAAQHSPAQTATHTGTPTPMTPAARRNAAQRQHCWHPTGPAGGRGLATTCSGRETGRRHPQLPTRLFSCEWPMPVRPRLTRSAGPFFPRGQLRPMLHPSVQRRRRGRRRPGEGGRLWGISARLPAPVHPAPCHPPLQPTYLH